MAGDQTLLNGDRPNRIGELGCHIPREKTHSQNSRSTRQDRQQAGSPRKRGSCSLPYVHLNARKLSDFLPELLLTPLALPTPRNMFAHA
jgi:hypothetical protein